MLDQAMTQFTEFFDWLRVDGTIWAIWTTASIAIFVGLRFLRAVLSGIFKSSKTSANSARNIIGKLFDSTNSLFLLVLSFIVSMPFVDVQLSDRWHSILLNGFMVIGVLQAAFWLKEIVQAFLDGAIERNSGDTSTLKNAHSIITLLTNIAIFAIALVMILQNLGQDVGALVAGLGIGGIAIALAAQNVFKDLFASLSIILDKPFGRGDFITWGTQKGTVEKIGLKTTKIRSLSGEQLIISNDQLLSNEIQNYKRMTERRVLLQLGVTYQTPRQALEVIPGRLRQLVEKRQRCRFDRSHMSGYGDSAIMFEIVFYVLSREYVDYMDEQQEFLLDIHKLFEELGADFAYPTRTLHVESQIVKAGPDFGANNASP